MPGPNTTGKPNAKDYDLGRGILYYAILDETTGLPDGDGWRDLGNAPSFNITPSEENLEHYLSRNGLKIKDRDISVSQQISGSFTLDEFNDENIAILLNGDQATFVNPTVAGFTCTLDSIKKGRWFDIFDDSSDDRAYDLPATATVTQDPSGTPAVLVAGTDYELDRVMGRIFFLSGSSTVVDGSECTVVIAATSGAATPINEVRAHEAVDVDVALKFISENQNNNAFRREYEFHRCKLRSQSDLALIGEDWATMTFNFGAETNTLGYPDSPVLTIRSHENSYAP